MSEQSTASIGGENADSKSDPPEGQASTNELQPERGRIWEQVNRYYDGVNRRLGGSYRTRRASLVEGLDGHILVVGGATGEVLPAIDQRAGNVAAVHILDPAKHRLAHANTKSSDYEFPVELMTGRVESLPFRDDQFDAVVSSGVFCSVTDVAAGLDEIGRVLRPGGSFRFLEHVSSRGLTRLAEAVVYPVWERVISGCDMRREIGAAIEASELIIADLDRLDDGLLPPWTYIKGSAKPPGSS